MTTRANLYIDQGIDFSIDLDVADDHGSAINISGHSFIGAAKKIYTENRSFSFNTFLVANTSGKIEISLHSNTSSLIEPGKYQYDIVMIAPTTIRTKLLEGLVFILPTMTSTGG